MDALDLSSERAGARLKTSSHHTWLMNTLNFIACQDQPQRDEGVRRLSEFITPSNVIENIWIFGVMTSVPHKLLDMFIADPVSELAQRALHCLATISIVKKLLRKKKKVTAATEMPEKMTVLGRMNNPGVVTVLMNVLGTERAGDGVLLLSAIAVQYSHVCVNIVNAGIVEYLVGMPETLPIGRMVYAIVKAVRRPSDELFAAVCQILVKLIAGDVAHNIIYSLRGLALIAKVPKIQTDLLAMSGKFAEFLTGGKETMVKETLNLLREMPEVQPDVLVVVYGRFPSWKADNGILALRVLMGREAFMGAVQNIGLGPLLQCMHEGDYRIKRVALQYLYAIHKVAPIVCADFIEPLLTLVEDSRTCEVACMLVSQIADTMTIRGRAHDLRVAIVPLVPLLNDLEFGGDEISAGLARAMLQVVE